MSDRAAAAAVEAAIAGEAKLDAHELRADFPIFQQRIHGKPLAYLDSAVSAQKPRQVLDALRAFYETSYTNVHPEISRLVDEYATEHAVQNPPQGLGRPGEIQPVQLQALAALAAGDPRMSERDCGHGHPACRPARGGCPGRAAQPATRSALVFVGLSAAGGEALQALVASVRALLHGLLAELSPQEWGA